VRHPGIMPGTRQISAAKPHLRPLSIGIRHRFADAFGGDQSGGFARFWGPF
jgi:hypothetical protein